LCSFNAWTSKQLTYQKKYTLDEYIQIDETGMQRHEYHYGKLAPIPGDTLLENEICLNLFILLHISMAKWGFNIFVENVKVKIEGVDIYVYPDVVVMKEQPTESLPALLPCGRTPKATGYFLRKRRHP